MTGESITDRDRIALPNGAIADVLKPDLLYIDESRSINGVHDGKFVCRVRKSLMTPAFLDFCTTKHEFLIEQVYVQYCAHPTKRYRVVDFLYPENDPDWVYVWVETTPISIVPFDKLVRKSIAKFDPNDQDMVLLEEMLELGIEILHRRRNRGSTAGFIEELTHVMVSSQVLKHILGIDDCDIQAQAQKKLEEYGWDQLTV